MNISKLKEDFNYNPETGEITHLKNGKPAFSARQSSGHMHGKYLGKYYKAHRIAWVLHYGEFPLNDIDHINGVRDDNRIENLRDVTKSENMRNAKKYCRNTSGKSGVSFSQGAWRVKTKVNGLWYSKRFANFEAACMYRDDLFRSLGFSDRHGQVSV